MFVHGLLSPSLSAIFLVLVAGEEPPGFLESEDHVEMDGVKISK